MSSSTPRAALLLLVAACSSEPAPLGTTIRFDLDADLHDPAHFFDVPYPSDLRLDADGAPDVVGFPNEVPLDLVETFKGQVAARRGFPVVPVAYFLLTEVPALRNPDAVVPATTSSEVFLVDVDPDSPDRGRIFPTQIDTPLEDVYVPETLIAVGPRPGFVLHTDRTYAYVVRRQFGDWTGAPLDVDPAFADLAAGDGPADAAAVYAPLWDTLDELGVPRAEIAGAAVFTTGDVVADLSTLSSELADLYPLAITGLAVDPDDGATHARFCELHGTISYPQFQRGTPPFDTEGLFEIGGDGLPVKQRDETAPIAITLPNGTMPAGGYPLVLYFHGSGGLSTQAIDKGASLVAGDGGAKGLGPSHVLAAHGLATAGSALPVNPERLPGAAETAYLNVNNLPAFRDTFRQGVIEQRMFLGALESLRIDPATVAACTGLALPSGETAYRFDGTKVLAQGQSMGGMYTNMIGAVEPKIRAVVPTGAGGYWSFMILRTDYVPGAAGLVGFALGTPRALTYMHPAMHLIQTAWETVDPIVFAPRLAWRPLAGHPTRPVYEPVGEGDEYFPTVIYDAMALSYGHLQAGDEVWPEMQDALSLDDRDGFVSYPVIDNQTNEAGGAFTGVVVQYAGDGIEDPHQIYRQLDEVKYQYGCFFESFLRDGRATVPAPAALGTPCP